MSERLECTFGLVTGHGQFCSQGAGEDLLGRLQAVQGDFIENACGLAQILLLISLVSSRKTQQGAFFRSAGGACLLQQLFDAGLRGARQLAQIGRRRAGTGGQQAGEAESGKRAQASDHLNVPGT